MYLDLRGCSFQETTTLKKGFRIGGCGSGKVAQCEGETLQGIKFELPHGDRTIIEVQMSQGRGDGEQEGAEKFKVGSFYMVAKELSKSLTSPLLMSGYVVETVSGGGQVVSMGTNSSRRKLGCIRAKTNR